MKRPTIHCDVVERGPSQPLTETQQRGLKRLIRLIAAQLVKEAIEKQERREADKQTGRSDRSAEE
jgi:hypothetical protein